MAKLLECVWVKCHGEAHSNFNIDHCGICMPYWLWYPTCPLCGRKLGWPMPALKDTTPAIENRMSARRLWCRACKKHVRYIPEPEDVVMAPAPVLPVPIVLRRTTELDALKRGEAFTWGEVVAIHSVGAYAVVEHHPWMRTENRMVLTGQPDRQVTEFQAYVDGKDCSQTFGSLEAALAAAIADKAEGPNHRADIYFIKSLGLEA
jgi:hypothetical protein